MVKRAAIYARLSVTTEESVSIERQVDSCRQLAASRDWTVVLEAVDDGVSASKLKPSQRAGWSTLLQSEESFEAVIVWKIDRLARSTLDFLTADETLRSRGAGLVAVENPIDMTTPEGRAFATMLAVFAEMEASAMSSRVTAARAAILKAGRRPGGKAPYGWMNVPNPDGPGVVLAQDPDRIASVVQLVSMALEGRSVYHLARWMDDNAAPRAPRANRKHDRWPEASVESLVRNPVLAGMTRYQPGRKPHRPGLRADDQHKEDPDAVLIGVDGLPVVDESVAIISTDDRRRLLAILDGAKRPGSRPRQALQPALLAGLLRCGSCRGTLHRAVAAKTYPVYRCQNRGCVGQVQVSRPRVEEHVETAVLEQFGAEPVITSVVVAEADVAPRLRDIEEQIELAARDMQQDLDDADEQALRERLRALKRERAEARATGDGVATQYRVSARTFRQHWSAADTLEERQRLLRTRLEFAVIEPGGQRGKRFDLSRVSPRWREFDEVEIKRQRRMVDLAHFRGFDDRLYRLGVEPGEVEAVDEGEK